MIAEIVRSFELSMDHCRRLLADVPDEQMSQSIDNLNHATWIAGHLAHSFQAIGRELGIAPWLPDDWARLFETGSRPLQTGYPSKRALLEALEHGQQRLVDALGKLQDRDLAAPLPDERYRHIFPTLGSAVLHILTVHAATHIGQLSAWRRALGFPPVADPM